MTTVTDAPEPPAPTVTPFRWTDWSDLWTVRRLQLVEAGVPLAHITIPTQPASTGTVVYEWDFHHLDQVYLRGAGQFWIARLEGQPVGYVGGQDRGTVVELRRMYVHAPARRRGIGRALVHALLANSRAHGVSAVEVWTAPGGAGAALYRACGFAVVPVAPPLPPCEPPAACYQPAPGEIRMRYAF